VLWCNCVHAHVQSDAYGQKRRHVVEQIMQCKYDFKGRRWKRVSPQAKSFIEDLLGDDAEDRATAEQAMQSMWLNKRYTATFRGPMLDEIDTILLLTPCRSMQVTAI
jgi:serine/threonine protein kinase